jgi:hypothetical protein
MYNLGLYPISNYIRKIYILFLSSLKALFKPHFRKYPAVAWEEVIYKSVKKPQLWRLYCYDNANAVAAEAAFFLR